MPFPQSPQWSDGKFRNRLARHDAVSLKVLWDFFFGGSPHRRPHAPVPIVPLTAATLGEPTENGWRIVWLGHSTSLVELDGVRLLIDPVFGERVSPVSWIGERRFFPPPLPLSELPHVDTVLLSHDHYDHLDKSTVRALAHRDMTWLVPLGVGNLLTQWGVPATRIVECDWWETHTLGTLTLTATPARHFSGRGPRGDRTLWCGWSIAGGSHRLYYAGDSAMQHEFVEIGERLGPFDVTMIEIGAYSGQWADVHLGPEQAVEAHIHVRGRHLLPVHWGLFNLALHGWTEPIERAVEASRAHGVSLLTPQPGELITSARIAALGENSAPNVWWPALPWERAEISPVRSSGL
jgi:L-ascorbate metabolism protein UlaG (beta-lactamase superfamily)